MELMNKQKLIYSLIPVNYSPYFHFCAKNSFLCKNENKR